MKFLSVLTAVALSLTLTSVAFAAGGGGGKKHTAGDVYPQPKPNHENAVEPGAVKLLEPAFNSSASDSVTLKWQEATDAANYHVQVATDPNFKWLKVDQHMHSGTSFEVTGLEAGQHYYWRVAASNQTKWAGSTKGTFSKSMFVTK